MTISNRSTTTSVRLMLIAGIAISGMFALALPSFAHAATYAFVNHSGNVATVTANDWMSAIATAPNIATHSGVLLLTVQADYAIVGDSVGGV